MFKPLKFDCIQFTGIFAEKNVNCKSYSHSFIKNISVYAIFNDQSFNDTLTNDIVSFEPLGPGCLSVLLVRVVMFVYNFILGVRVLVRACCT